MKILTFVTDSDIENIEPQLQRYKFANQIDFSNIIQTAYSEFLVDLRNKGLDMRYIGTPLILEDSTSISYGTPTAEVGSVSSVDNINRSMLTLEVSSLQDSIVFEILGCNTQDGTFKSILSEIVVLEPGTYTYFIEDFYTYYRLDSTGTTATYSAYLTESVYHNLHLYKALYMIYKSLDRAMGSKWEDKADMYEEKYNMLLGNALFFSDTDKNGEISSDEASNNNRIVYIGI